METAPLHLVHRKGHQNKLYDNEKHTPFTPALPLLYAYREALSIMLEEGLQNVFNRHKVCSDALYGGLSAMGLSPICKRRRSFNFNCCIKLL